MSFLRKTFCSHQYILAEDFVEKLSNFQLYMKYVPGYRIYKCHKCGKIKITGKDYIPKLRGKSHNSSKVR